MDTWLLVTEFFVIFVCLTGLQITWAGTNTMCIRGVLPSVQEELRDPFLFFLVPHLSKQFSVPWEHGCAQCVCVMLASQSSVFLCSAVNHTLSYTECYKDAKRQWHFSTQKSFT